MAHSQQQIRQFLGIQQQYDGSLMNEGSAHDARNMDTSDGNLSVAKGYVRAFDQSIPLANSEKLLKLIIARDIKPKFYVVSTQNIYRYIDDDPLAPEPYWGVIYTFSPAITSNQIDYLQTHIGLKEYIVVATGQTQMLKIDIDDDSVALFGTGETTYEGSVSDFSAKATTTIEGGTAHAGYAGFAPAFPDAKAYEYKWDGTRWVYEGAKEIDKETTVEDATVEIKDSSYTAVYPELETKIFKYNGSAWIDESVKNVEATTTLANGVVTVKPNTFKNKVGGAVGTYEFSCTATTPVWKLDGNVVDLAEYGITVVSGTIATGKTITVTIAYDVVDLATCGITLVHEDPENPKTATDDTITVNYHYKWYTQAQLEEVGVTYTGTPAVDDTITVDMSDLVLTISPAASEVAQSYALYRGIHINDTWYEMDKFLSGTEVKLLELADALHPPVIGDDVVIDGGCSSAHCNYVGTFYSRMFCAGDPDAPCRLYWSAATGSGRTFEDWASVDGASDASGGFVEVGDSDGDIIIGIARLSSQLVIFKRHSVYRFYGDRPSTFTLERLENYSEEMSHSGCIVKYDAPYFMTKSGLHTYDGTGIIPMNEGVRMLRRYLDTVNTFSQSRAIHADNKLYFSCRTADSGYDDAIIVYDMARQSFMIRDGFTVADITAYDGKLYLLNKDIVLDSPVGFVNIFEQGDDYAGVPINAYWETQHTDLGAKQYRKQIARLYMRGGGDGEFALTIFADRNKEEKHYRWTEVTDGDLLIVPYKVDRATSFWLRLENEQGSHFHIDGGIDINFDRELQG